ncbi:hypothetical protein EHF33_01775 [Deinococcus psychrotolerans]|uniref:Uncharacterized protein n=2 Tax=Deinococcus TaxID=1298 RepID=A0A553V2L0_9DEIO|nr:MULTISPECIES: hypothetical protein [Deinococcus]AZI41637.1 hypothetical protein EHF33_01775 [Deinococcus psychrotolerans]TSA86696.1 hypothetical protein FNU79_05715 [Deinococcus detaillensis]
MSSQNSLNKNVARLGLPALLGGLMLSSCAPVLGNVIDTSPSRKSAGPLIVGQTWAISGQLSGTSLSKTLSVPTLVEVQDGSGTLSVADQATAAQVPSGSYQYVSYTNSDQLKKASFVWNEAAAGGGVNRYECLSKNVESLPLTGVLTLKRQSESTVLVGTCTATPTNPPPLPTK